MENSGWVKTSSMCDVDVARLVGCDYDHSILRTPVKTGKQVGYGDIYSKQAVVVYFIGGVTYTEIAALRFLAAQVWVFGVELSAGEFPV